MQEQKNRLHGLIINDVWNTEPIKIKREVHTFFGRRGEHLDHTNFTEINGPWVGPIEASNVQI